MSLEARFSFWATFYFKCSAKGKKIIQYIFYLSRKYKDVFPSIAAIARFAKCHHSTVQRFFQSKKDIFLTITPSFKRRRQMQNNYCLDNNFFNFLEWLQAIGWMNSSKNKFKTILKAAESRDSIFEYSEKCDPINISLKQENKKENIDKLRPPNKPELIGKRDPYIEIGIYIDSNLGEESINNNLKNLGIDQKTKIYLSKKYSEYILFETKRSFLFAIDTFKIKKPNDYILTIAKNKQIDYERRRGPSDYA